MILGIDYGEKWCGLAVSEGSLAEPLKTVLTKNIFTEVKKFGPEKIVVGISEKNMARKTGEFIQELRRQVKCPIETADETLTSVEARKIESKNKQKQHAVAAALTLQRFLDSMGALCSKI